MVATNYSPYQLNPDNECVATDTSEGGWENKGEGTYSIKINGSNSARQAKISFSNSNTVMTSVETIVDETEPVTETLVLKRK